MKATALNLVILDDNTLIAGPLSRYLNNRFGERISVTTFFDADRCARSIDDRSHVIILDYVLNTQDKRNRKGQKLLDIIRTGRPKTEITVLSSQKEVLSATQEMQRDASEYILKREQRLSGLAHILGQVVTSPAKAMAGARNLNRRRPFLLFLVIAAAIASVGLLAWQYFVG